MTSVVGIETSELCWHYKNPPAPFSTNLRDKKGSLEFFLKLEKTLELKVASSGRNPWMCCPLPAKCASDLIRGRLAES